MPSVTYDIEGSPVLTAFMEDWSNRIVGIMGPFGSGKTVAMAAKSIVRTRLMPAMNDGKRRARFVVVRNT